MEHASRVCPTVCWTHLRLLLEGDFGGFPRLIGWNIRCRPQPARIVTGVMSSYVVMALLHDIGDTLGSLQPP